MSERTFLQFRVGPTAFGVGVTSVVEIIRIVALAPVPDAARDLLGVINLRGRVVPVFDLCRSLDLGVRPLSLKMYIVIVEVGGETIGVVVDDVLDVTSVPDDQVRASRAVGGGRTFAAAVARVDDEMVTLLNLEPLLDRMPTAEFAPEP
jgi:purine-binding chemotaxis protein CheW